ncbi:hypothetical protein B0H13DRAFT_1900591 [Mycena leptocephala]|nr:hypothetical protein B0H13DRAFT_1900591 [Mycena leptocephala]
MEPETAPSTSVAVISHPARCAHAVENEKRLQEYSPDSVYPQSALLLRLPGFSEPEVAVLALLKIMGVYRLWTTFYGILLKGSLQKPQVKDFLGVIHTRAPTQIRLHDPPHVKFEALLLFFEIQSRWLGVQYPPRAFQARGIASTGTPSNTRILNHSFSLTC